MKHADIKHPILIMIRGLPGSGKTYLAMRLEQALGEGHVVILDPDTVDLETERYLEFSKELEKEGLNRAIHPFRWLRKQACDAVVAGKSVMWNQPFTDRGIFERLIAFIQNHAHENGVQLPVLVVEVEIDPDIAKVRIAKRKQAGGHGPTDDTFGRRVSEYVSYADGFSTVVVQGKDDIAISVATVLAAIEDLTEEVSAV